MMLEREQNFQILLNNIYALEKSGANRMASIKIMSFIEEAISKNDYLKIDQFLTAIDLEKLSSRSLIGLIRSSVRIKNELIFWEQTYLNSWNQLIKLEKIPEKLFLGMLPPKI